MKSIEFISRLKHTLEQRGFSQLDIQPTPAPGVLLTCEYSGLPLRMDFKIGGTMTLEVLQPQSYSLTVRRESTVSRILDEVGHSREVKTGFQEFDQEYFVKLDPAGKLFFTPERVSAVRNLEPFDELVGGPGGLAVRKTWTVSTYSAEKAMADLEQLLYLAGASLA